MRYRIGADRSPPADRSSLETGPVLPASLIVHGLSAKTDGKPRLTEMSFVQRKNDLLAILGPSGAGKTSLFSALVGELKPEDGDLYLGELPLRTHGAQIREKLGFVPQDEHLFRTFTVRKLLRYSFELRSAIGKACRDQRVVEICEQLDISEQIDQLIGTLSGGQRKRVSIAAELLSEPMLLMLDEPTSGLDAGMDREVLEYLQKYAATDKTVIVITHSTEHLWLADRVLVVASGGRPVYFGSADGVLKGLGATTYAELMRKLISDPGPAATAYQNGPAVTEAVEEAERMAQVTPYRGGGPAVRRDPVLTGLRQLWVLIRRQIALVLTRGSLNRSDRHHPVRRLGGGLTVLGPLLIAGGGAAIAGLVSGGDGLGPGHGPHGSTSAASALSLLTTLSMLTGQALTYSDIVNDYPTIRREHRTGTLTLPVITAKWLVFALVAVLQALLITSVYLRLRPGPAYSVGLGPVAELFADLAAVTVAAMTLGLLISAALPKLEQAIAVVTGLSIAQIALNGVASNLSGNAGMNIASMVLPSRWGLAATAASIDLRRIAPTANPDALWHHTVSQWTMNLAMLGALTGAYFLLSSWVLVRRLNKPDK
jgi:ABC transport system ATP-binding/permease protein